jgi:hypothetical protein
LRAAKKCLGVLKYPEKKGVKPKLAIGIMHNAQGIVLFSEQNPAIIMTVRELFF